MSIIDWTPSPLDVLDPFGVLPGDRRGPQDDVLDFVGDKVGINGGGDNEFLDEKRRRQRQQQKVIDNADPNNPKDVIEAQFAAFGRSGGIFEPAIGTGFKDTNSYVKDALDRSRPNIPPSSIQPWECRIGLTNLLIPPLNVDVQQQFRTGTLAGGGVLRQSTPPKYNSGHFETRISMTLYFPNHESIWGFYGDVFKLDPLTTSDQEVDGFFSSLRGLITQFKYTPFLPVRNVYLNQTYNITGVVMESMNISTIQGFPFCVAVKLNMLAFNHEVFLPMIEDFNDAIHWGRLREYLSKAAQRLNLSANQSFLTTDVSDRLALDKPGTPDEVLRDTRKLTDQKRQEDLDRQSIFNKRYDWMNGKDFDLYYIDHDPARVVGPNLTDFRSNRDPESMENPQERKNWWEQLLAGLGFDINTSPSAGFDIASANSDLAQVKSQQLLDNILKREYTLLSSWLNRVSLVAATMGPGQLDEYLAVRYKDYGKNISEEERQEVRQRVYSAWFAAMFTLFLQDPYLQNVLSYQARKRGWLAIKEWEVPMRKLGLDPQQVIVNGVSVSMGNNISSLQVQLQDKPVYQHLGGLETRCDMSLTIFGESNLLQLRRLFDTVSGLARLEHGHAVLGFLGIKNVLTALCGMKYALPINFESESIPGFPHVYNVRLTFTDFDVFQQKREILSSEQQADLIEAFSKRNPFLRIKQHWSAFNAYPDMPLDIRDDTGTIVGHYEPDYYFRTFQTIDDDIAGWREKNKDPENPADNKLHVNFGNLDSTEQSQKIVMHGRGIDFYSGTEQSHKDLQWNEPFLSNVVDKPWIDGLTGPKETSNPHYDNSPSLNGQFDKMLKDMQFRNKDGRMVRAFPTFMLWLIDEGGMFAGVKLYDNFYGLQSVVDISLNESEDVLGDTLVIRLSNLYGRLSNKYRDLIDEDLYQNARIINTQLNRTRNLASGLSDYLVKLDTIELKPGVRIHLRMGYSANPNALDTVFNGMITQVDQGEVVTIVAQSDALELGAIINNEDKDGNTGSIDGAMMSGLWMSEPRDLMTRLLSMGSSGVRESLAHASRGAIFSENRYGIRHFGTILYDPMTDEEEAKQSKRSGDMLKLLQKGAKFTPESVVGSVTGFINHGLTDLVTNAWNNFHRTRDYELFKRNIYPGNGLGIGQYLGGDFADGGLSNSFLPTGLTSDGAFIDPTTGEKIVVDNVDPREILGLANEIVGTANDPGNLFGSSKYGAAGSADNPLWNSASPFIQAMGIARMQGIEDDPLGFDEISFRAQTYMKTVWDLFQICAALLPNYIVAVRPFEDRSTVFYGKPHWMYTSGVIPLSKGVDGTNSPTLTPPDEEVTSILLAIEKKYRQRETPTEFYERLLGSSNASGSNDPFSTAIGVNWDGGAIDALPLTHTTMGIELPKRHAKGIRGLHLPTSEILDVDVSQHKQLGGLLPPQWRHPFYMDRATGTNDELNFDDVLALREDGKDSRSVESKPTVGEPSAFEENMREVRPELYDDKPDPKTINTVLGEGTSKPGRMPDSGKAVPVDIEEYYIAMGWNYTKGGKENYYNGRARVLVFNTRTKKGVICAIADKTPDSIGTSGIVVSPDVWVLLESIDTDTYKVGFIADDYSMGPITSDNTGQFSVGAALAKNANLSSGDNNIANLPKWMQNKPGRLDNADTGTNPLKYALKFGSTDRDIPIDFTDPESGLVDPVGQAAAEVYSNDGEFGSGRVGYDGRSFDEAVEIWDELRERYENEDDPWLKQIFSDEFPQYAIVKPQWTSSNILEAREGFSEIELKPESKQKYTATLKAFMDFLWQNPYHRGWVIKTVDRKFDGGLSAITGDVGAITEDIPLLGGVSRGVADFGNSVDNVVSSIGGTLGLGGGGPNYNWDFDRLHGLFRVYITQGPAAGISWMLSHDTPGKDQVGLIGRSTEQFLQKVWDPMYDYLSTVAGGINNALNGFVSLIRVGLLGLTQGLGMTGYMTKAANYLNRSFNDSIYYNTSYGLGTLMYLADNPFTREYGEPVVEIREPFQRVHHINSFQHILNNGIQQNTDGVSTVVTATTRGKDPVTVHFDKGAPPERQMEKKVESGLWFDKPKGIMGNLFNPQAATRNAFNVINAQPDELLANRVARYHLKKSLQDIYQGEIVILGDASIRPHDLIYLGDAYEQIYGMFEVEAVTHHFTSETGFVTSITPNALVTVNDPMRWSAMAMMKTQLTQLIIRAKLRHSLGIKNNKGIYGLAPSVDSLDLANTLSSEIMGAVDYTGGASALVKDFASTGGAGVLVGGVVGGVVGGPVGAGIGAAIGGGLVWGAAKWVTENLLDQHGCYIQYLTKNGTPMDAGLSYNNGVAVGRQHISTLFANSLRIPVSINRDGHSRITTNDLLAQLGYKENEIEDFITDVDLWNNEINKEILKLSNRSPDGIPFQQVDAKIVTVIKAIDGVSFEVAEKDIAPNGVRLAGITAPVPLIAAPIGEADAGTTARQYLKKRLITDPEANGFSATVALRIDPNTPKDTLGRVLAWVFHTVPSTVALGDSAQRNKVLEAQAERWPQIEWDSFLPDGNPYTYNWESVIAGVTNIDKDLFNTTIPNQGVEGGQ